jgi:hypothetical protein
MTRPGRAPIKGERSGAGLLFGVALGLALLLTAALVWMLAPLGGEHAAVGAAYGTLLWSLRLWAALAWAFVIGTGLRLVRRR